MKRYSASMVIILKVALVGVTTSYAYKHNYVVLIFNVRSVAGLDVKSVFFFVLLRKFVCMCVLSFVRDTFLEVFPLAYVNKKLTQISSNAKYRSVFFFQIQYLCY